MSTGLDPLILDLVEWVAREPRTYSEVMEAWRTSCPRLTVWEDAVERGYLVRLPGSAHAAGVAPTEAGLRFLEAAGRGAGINQAFSKIRLPQAGFTDASETRII